MSPRDEGYLCRRKAMSSLGGSVGVVEVRYQRGVRLSLILWLAPSGGHVCWETARITRKLESVPIPFSIKYCGFAVVYATLWRVTCRNASGAQ